MRREGMPKQSAVFLGKRHDNKNFKVQILLSRNFVVIAEAPRNLREKKVRKSGTNKRAQTQTFESGYFPVG